MFWFYVFKIIISRRGRKASPDFQSDLWHVKLRTPSFSTWKSLCRASHTRSAAIDTFREAPQDLTVARPRAVSRCHVHPGPSVLRAVCLPSLHALSGRVLSSGLQALFVTCLVPLCRDPECDEGASTAPKSHSREGGWTPTGGSRLPGVRLQGSLPAFLLLPHPASGGRDSR